MLRLFASAENPAGIKFAVHEVYNTKQLHNAGKAALTCQGRGSSHSVVSFHIIQVLCSEQETAEGRDARPVVVLGIYVVRFSQDLRAKKRRCLTMSYFGQLRMCSQDATFLRRNS